MNVFDKAIVSLMAPSQKRSPGSTLGNLFPFFGGASTTVGQKITANGALKVSAFYCGVNAIANSVALLPKSVYIEKAGQREREPRHPLDYLIHDEPNSFMTAFVFWFTMTVSMILRGNAYALIERDGGGAALSLHFLHPDEVEVREYNGQLFYKYKGKTYLASEIIHIPGFAFNGITGLSAVQFAADNLGVSLSADEFAGNAYSEKASTYGVAESEMAIDNKGRQNIEMIFNNALVAGDKRHRVAVLDEGLKYKSIMLSPNESEFIKAKAAGVEDVARWLNIPLHKLHTSGEGGYNFLVEMSQEYLSGTIQPIGEKIKQELHRKCLGKPARISGLYVYLNYKKLLETNPKLRSEFYKNMVLIKAMNPNEVRELEDMNPYKTGDQFLQMANLFNEDQVTKILEDETAA